MMKVVLRKLIGNWLPRRRPHATDPAEIAVSCGVDGCYEMADGTLVPVGDLGLSPKGYRLEP